MLLQLYLSFPSVESLSQVELVVCTPDLEQEPEESNFGGNATEYSWKQFPVEIQQMPRASKEFDFGLLVAFLP